MSKKLSEGDVLVEKTLNTDSMYKVEEDAPPYPVKARPYGKHSGKVIEIPENALRDYVIGSPQSVVEEILQTGGFIHEDHRCEAGVIVTKGEVVKAFGELSLEVSYEALKDWLTTGIGAGTAAEIIKILLETYSGREETAVSWFENIEMNDLGKPQCKECGYVILDRRY